MTDFFGILAVGLFVALLFLNFYFRSKILKIYKVLIKNRVEFEAIHILNKTKMEAEVLPRYPKLREEIIAFCNHIRKSVLIAIILVLAIVLVGFILRSL